MPYFICLWLTITGIVVKANTLEIKREYQTVKLFEHTDYGYRTYIVQADR